MEEELKKEIDRLVKENGILTEQIKECNEIAEDVKDLMLLSKNQSNLIDKIHKICLKDGLCEQIQLEIIESIMEFMKVNTFYKNLFNTRDGEGDKCNFN